MAKHTQTIRRQFADELFVFGHFVGLALKGLISLHNKQVLSQESYNFFKARGNNIGNKNCVFSIRFREKFAFS